MASSGQTYKNHTRFFPLFHFFVMPILVANVVWHGWNAWTTPSNGAAFATLVAVGLMMGALAGRVMALTVQDRIIRLEMHLRLRERLPADMQGRIADLTRDQLVALRFASDGELADVVRQVLAGTLTTRKDIKLAVKDWRGDYLRA